MDPDQMVTLSLEGAFSVLILTIAYKLYRSRIKTHSGCCLKENNGIILDSQNSGVSNENDVLAKI
jgi:hypothetical protein